MPTVSVQLEIPVTATFRVAQVAGMLDVSLNHRLKHQLTAEVPGLEEPWSIGAIIGPSGSGKTTLARAAYKDALYTSRPWPRGRAIIDCLGDGPIKEITRLFTAVGLGSIPTWLKPYSVLSTGERFRADLARAILGARGSGLGARKSKNSQPSQATPPSPEPPAPSPLLVFDEFTSSLDRPLARTTSAALSRLLRRADSRLRFVAVTCHSDIIPWLAPDWVLDLSDPTSPRLNRGRLVTPPLELRIERVPQAMWEHFKNQHYLAGGLAASATCYGTFCESEAPAERLSAAQLGGSLALPRPVAFCAVVAALGWKKMKRITRLVTLSEFQELGIASRLAEAVAEIEIARGNRVTITATHPAIVGHCANSPSWHYLGLKKTGSTRQRYQGRDIRTSQGRPVASFEFVATAKTQ
jgi:hypothetical protein